MWDMSYERKSVRIVVEGMVIPASVEVMTVRVYMPNLKKRDRPLWAKIRKEHGILLWKRVGPFNFYRSTSAPRVSEQLRRICRESLPPDHYRAGRRERRKYQSL